MNRNWRETGGARRPLEREKVIYLSLIHIWKIGDFRGCNPGVAALLDKK